jgi:hypothetical protein
MVTRRNIDEEEKKGYYNNVYICMRPNQPQSIPHSRRKIGKIRTVSPKSWNLPEYSGALLRRRFFL